MSESRIHIDGLRPADVALLKTVASEAAQQAVSQTLTAMGLDPTKPFDAQADMQFLRATRQRCEGAIGKAIITVVALIIVGAIGMFFAGVQSKIPDWVSTAKPHP